MKAVACFPTSASKKCPKACYIMTRPLLLIIQFLSFHTRSGLSRVDTTHPMLHVWCDLVSAQQSCHQHFPLRVRNIQLF